MTDILDYISTWSVLKWVVLVLIAGFIGQFGRMMAEAIEKESRGGRRARIGRAESLERGHCAGKQSFRPSPGNAEFAGRSPCAGLRSPVGNRAG